MTIMLRLSPLIPFNVFNYVMGLTKVSLKDYAIGGLGMIPGTAVYVYIGATGAALGSQEEVTESKSAMALRLTSLILGTIIAFVGIILVSVKVKRILKRKLDERKVLAELENKEQPVPEPDLEKSKLKMDSQRSSPSDDGPAAIVHVEGTPVEAS